MTRMYVNMHDVSSEHNWVILTEPSHVTDTGGFFPVRPAVSERETCAGAHLAQIYPCQIRTSLPFESEGNVRLPVLEGRKRLLPPNIQTTAPLN